MYIYDKNGRKNDRGGKKIINTMGYNQVYSKRTNYKINDLKGTLYELYGGGPSGGLYVVGKRVYSWHCEWFQDPVLKLQDKKASELIFKEEWGCLFIKDDDEDSDDE